MQRTELSIADADIVKKVAELWGFSVQYVNYIDVGGTFAFRLVTWTGDNTFLKVYVKSKPSDPVENVTPLSLRTTCTTLDILRNKHKLLQIPVILKTKEGNYFHEERDLIFILSAYIEGMHPESRYEIKELRSKQLAAIFLQLHSVPISEFPDLRRETFNIDYALGIEKWLNIKNIANTKNKPMLEQIVAVDEGLFKCLHTLKQLQAKFSNLPMDFVLTHGDAHHFNVMQNEMEIFLIDWDNVKIGPRERDLWFYEFAPLMNDYLQNNPGFKINHDLCLYYQTQRFLEDLRIYLEQENENPQQSHDNLPGFLNHWGWMESYERIKNLLI